MIKGLVAGVVNLSVGRGAVLSPVESIAAASVVGFFGYGVSLVFFVLGLRHLGSARTGAYFSMAPFIGALIAIGLFGEPATVRLIIAALLMGIGLYLHLAERHAHEHKHDPLEHTHNHVHDAHHQHCLGPEDAKGEPHSHVHRHEPLVHAHAHYPDLHHRHRHVG